MSTLEKTKINDVDLDKLIKNKLGLLSFYLNKEINATRKPFLPDKNFYQNLSSDNSSLRSMSNIILNYLNEPIDALQTHFVTNNSGHVITQNGNTIPLQLNDAPGVYTKIKGEDTILMDQKYIKDSKKVVAILAHEIMHYYLISRHNIIMTDKMENELLTDVATIYFGLGILVVNGMTFQSTWFLSIIAFFLEFSIFQQPSQHLDTLNRLNM